MVGNRFTTGTGLVLITLMICFAVWGSLIGLLQLLDVPFSQFQDPNQITQSSTLIALIGFVVTPILTVVLVNRLIQKRAFSFFTTQPDALHSFEIFFALGASVKWISSIIALRFSPSVSLGVALDHIHYGLWALYFSWSFILIFLRSFGEELLFRAYPLTTSERNPFAMIIVAACLSSLAQFLTNGAVELWALIQGLLFGVAAGLIYLKNKNLWAAVGFHMGFSFIAHAFSDKDWRFGGIIKIQGLETELEIKTTCAVLALFCAFKLYKRFHDLPTHSVIKKA